MPYFKDIRESCLSAYCFGDIDDTELVLLYDIHRSKNPDLNHNGYKKFDLDDWNEDQCLLNFRFHKSDIYELQESLNIPESILCYNNVPVDGIEALCVCLKRFAYPCRYADMVPMFGRPVPQISIISNHISNLIYESFGHLLCNLNQEWLNPHNLQFFADQIHAQGAALPNCWGFIDGTVRPISRPQENQRTLYNGHKKVHALKFQSVVTPNGLIANLYGPVEGCRHDSAMLRMSDLLQKLQISSINSNNDILCIYGDPAYPLRPQLQSPFKGANITPDQELWNKSMSRVRVAVEWIFGDIVNYFKFMDFKKNLKIGLSPVGKMYIVCGLLHNARACLYGNNTSFHFNVDPPKLKEYFILNI